MPRKQKRKTRLSPAERSARRIARQHIKFVRDTFRGAGFTRLADLSEREFEFGTAKSDFDDVFLSQNVLVFLEYTTSSEASVADHLRKKFFVYRELLSDTEAFVAFLREKFAKLSDNLDPSYSNHHYQIRFVYASRQAISERTKRIVDNVTYLDYHHVRYFVNVVGTVKLSARFELLEFLRIKPSLYGPAILESAAAGGKEYGGSVLPEAQSHLPEGYKVVSFYVDAEALISRAYVLRRDGWRSGSNVYQRLISRKKIEAIRLHLLGKNGAFLNNIIVTLPSATKIIQSNGDNSNPVFIRKTKPANVSIPATFNSIGLIDGQHRVFSYYEGGAREAEIAVLRKQQNLLVTGIVFPQTASTEEQLRFSAKLFLEINSNQTNAKSDLKQEIGLILRPYSPESIAKRVINELNDGSGALGGKFERFFFEKGKLKTTSIVSYGLKHLVRLGGDDSLFSIWQSAIKDDVAAGKSETGLDDYVKFVVGHIGQFINAVAANMDSQIWSTDRKNGGLLNTTFVNGLVACLRQVVRAGKITDFQTYKAATINITSFEFGVYKSSQYNKMGEALFLQYLA